ncbi:acyl-CoA dehydrogenase family protein [Candidatus Poriferisocius sp.]|uniref:acyl-CoA dehydrogenase family protein n=1 Tax=Candidatus Poriferisocius sp. TaxID=3101276 RepID=UPI003B5987AB
MGGTVAFPRPAAGHQTRGVAPTLAQFTAEARAFLDANAARVHTDEFTWGIGSDEITVYAEKNEAEEAAAVRAAQRWRAEMWDAGFGWITGPPEFGGRGLGPEYERAYLDLEATYRVPSQTVFGTALGVVAPTLLAHGSDWLKQRYLVGLFRGEILACQLLSEPGAGSDLASLSTRAVRDGDQWVINGQKVWSSRAHYSHIGLLLARTDPDAPKHQGITAFIHPLDTAGTEVRPLRQMTGGSEFNEVFFEDARISDRYRVGGVNAGWSVFRTTLQSERASIGARGAGYGGSGLVGLAAPERVVRLARHLGLADDPTVRQNLARLYTGHRLVEWNATRRPAIPPAAAKYGTARHMNWAASMIAGLLGPRICADTGEWGTYAWKQLLLGTPAMRIGGGTDEVMKNSVGEGVLGLPREPR